MKNNILVVAAHPDDEVLGCGGIIAKSAEEGNNVYCLILGEGITSRLLKRKEKDLKLKLLKKHSRESAKILGIKEIFFSDFPDNKFDCVPLIDIVRRIEFVKSYVKPLSIFTHSCLDLNIDHRITLDAVLTAARPVKEETTREIYSFEILSSTEWSNKGIFRPDIYIDISTTIQRKIAAMKKYKTEIRKWPHPRSAQAIEILAKKRGCEVGLYFAEAFKVVREVRK